MSDLTLSDLVCEFVIDRIRRGIWLSPEDLDYIATLSSKYTNQLFEQLSDEEAMQLAGLLWKRKEDLMRQITEDSIPKHGDATHSEESR